MENQYQLDAIGQCFFNNCVDYCDMNFTDVADDNVRFTLSLSQMYHKITEIM